MVNKKRKTKTTFHFDTVLGKTITVSTDGSVYVGCSAPWSDIDNIKLFNITQCNGNFIELLEKCCWEYPVNSKIKKLREKYAAIKWCQSHGYEVVSVTDDVALTIKALIDWTYVHENRAKEIHEEFPMLNHTEVNEITSATIPVAMQLQGFTDEFVKLYLSECTFITKELIDNYNVTFGQNYLNTLVDAAKKRTLSSFFGNLIKIFGKHSNS